MRGPARAAFALATIALAACASDGGQHRRAELSRRIVDDSIAYNEAYSGAITGQILLNVLRAYNRQPRQYMSMSGFNNADPDSREAVVGIGGLPLGQLGSEWGEGALGLSNTTTLTPGYNVEPFSTQAFAQIAFLPTAPSVFRHYWETGWNRDLLLLLLVDSMDVRDGEGGVQTFNNGAGTIDSDCVGDQFSFGGCLFVRAARELAQTTRGAPAPVRMQPGRCAPIAAYGVAEQPHALRQAKQEAGPLDRPALCPVMIDVGARRYILKLRSLDATVYYVGELLRRNEAGASVAPEGVLEARLGVLAPGAYLPDDRVPLFRVVESDDESERDYAATVSYAGRRYSAGAPANRFCFDPSPAQACRGVTRGDRSGTVLELLAGVLAYNQSEDAVSAPQTSTINTR